jgi:hypothetical protein
MKDKAWVGKVARGDNFSLEHLRQSIELWVNCKMCNYMNMSRTTLLGNLRQMRNTPPPLRCNFWDPPHQFCTRRCGKLGHLPKLNYSLGYLHRTKYIWRTGYKSMGSQTTAFALFASNRRKQFATFRPLPLNHPPWAIHQALDGHILPRTNQPNGCVF